MLKPLPCFLALTAAANRTFGIAPYPVLPPLSAQCVVGGKFAVRRRADTEQHFERFGGLGRSDNADQGRKNAEQCTSTVAGLFAVKQAGIAGRIGKIGTVHGDLSVKADGRGGNQRRARGNGGTDDRLACGIIVGTIKDNVGGVCQFDKLGLIEKFGHGGNVCLAVDLFQTALTVQVGDVNYGGHLANDAVLRLCHEVRMRWLAKLGWSEMDAGGAGLIMADAAVQYLAQGHHGDELSVEMGAAGVAGVGFSLLYRICRISDGL